MIMCGKGATRLCPREFVSQPCRHVEIVCLLDRRLWQLYSSNTLGLSSMATHVFPKTSANYTAGSGRFQFKRVGRDICPWHGGHARC